MRAVPVNLETLVGADQVRLAGSADEFGELAGYMLDDTFATPRALIWTWGYVLVVPNATADQPMIERVAGQASSRSHQDLDDEDSSSGRMGAVREVEPRRLIPVPVHTLRPVASGQSYRIVSPPAQGLARPELADALESVFESFAQANGFGAGRPLEIHLARGFAAGSPGHGEGRAIDIDAVAGKSLVQWKKEWDEAMKTAEALPDPQAKDAAIGDEKQRNLGHGHYAALLAHGGWRTDRDGWRPYRNVMQLFGPWTAAEGPWKTMRIENPTPYQRQRLADQQWVFRAHQDHIHVAR